MKLKQFKHELRGDYDCDKWGHVMLVWFEVCDHLTVRGEYCPKHWEYRAGAFGAQLDKKSYWYPMLKKCSVRQLLIIGNFLERLSRFLKRADLAY